MPNTQPLVSIIIPAYNAEKYIQEAIDSVLEQSYQNWELIIINDGSTDTTEKIIYSYADERIKYHYQKNAGVSAARNSGMALARGGFLTFLDADDALTRDSIGLRVNYFVENSDVDLVHGIASIRNENLKIEHRTSEPFKYDQLLDLVLKLDNRLFFNPSYMIRYDKIANLKFKVGMTHCEDILFLFSLLYQGCSYDSVSQRVYLYRVSGSSAMSNIDAMIKGYLELLASIKEKKISYFRTTRMRLKIIRIVLSWSIRSGNLKNLTNIYKAIM